VKFLMIYKPGVDGNVPPSERELADMGQFIEQMVNEGVLLDTAGLLPSAAGVRVRVSDGNFSVTDGPFAETKEIIGGYAVVQAKSKEHAIELAKRFLSVCGTGESEIRQIAEADDFGAEFTPELREAEQRQRERMSANR
jgi:hypothetical protein